VNARRALGRVLLAGGMLAVVAGAPLQAQVAGSSHEVRRGDTLFGVARKTMYDGVTRNQMILAIWRANQSAFPGGNINLLEVGTVLAIPARGEVAKIEPAEADRQVRGLLALEVAAKRYREGLALERRGDDQGALASFLEAGEAGNGMAQRKLGQIYDMGNTAVQRDYQSALKWYQKAREQGVEMDKPLQRTTPK
jgi:pilus assembly protein FimV